MKRVQIYKRLLLIATCWLVLWNCHDPAPQKDLILGKLISNSSCQKQNTYLVDIAILHPYKTGFTNYTDTLSIGVTRFNRVIQLNTTRLEGYQLRRLQDYKLGDKISIGFIERNRSVLFNCLSSPPRSIETIIVDEFGMADY